jgi:hypothetical protein
MADYFLELERLRANLQNKGLEAGSIDNIVRQAEHEIESAINQFAGSAMQSAVEVGVQASSADFINELYYNAGTQSLITSSGNTNFSEPPFPMLPSLLKNAKPMKDGSGVYKVIPVGTPGKGKPRISDNIFDAQKKIHAERAEEAKRQYSHISPSGSKTTFRTASSKQSASEKWVKPAKQNDFTADLQSINNELHEEINNKVEEIVRSYEEGF